MNTITYFEPGKATEGSFKVIPLPPEEIEVLEGEDGIMLRLWKDERGRPLWFKARLTYDAEFDPGTCHEDPVVDGALYLVPIIEEKNAL